VLKENVEMSKNFALSFRGLVTGLSQVFYLPGNSKCFFIAVVPSSYIGVDGDVKRHKEDSTERRIIVARLKGLHDSFGVFET
jgi:hypothetical protein